MKKYKRLLKEEITGEMIDWFNERTQRHIDLVKKYGKLIFDSTILNFMSGSDQMNLYEDLLWHDQSKLEEPERTGYIYISWDYHCKDLNIPYEIPEDKKELTNTITNRHVCSNKHHPEYWMKNKTLDIINRVDRDQPNDTIIDCTDMPLTYIASMCADWMAMSEEKDNSPQEWAKKNVNIRWEFNKQQEDFIYKILNTIWSN